MLAFTWAGAGEELAPCCDWGCRRSLAAVRVLNVALAFLWGAGLGRVLSRGTMRVLNWLLGRLGAAGLLRGLNPRLVSMHLGDSPPRVVAVERLRLVAPDLGGRSALCMDLGLSFEARDMSATLHAPELPPEVYCDGFEFRTRLRVRARYRARPRSLREARGLWKVFDRVSFSLREPPEHLETDLRPGHRRAPPVRRLPYVGQVDGKFRQWLTDYMVEPNRVDWEIRDEV